MSSVAKLVEGLADGKMTLGAALAEALNNNNVTAGCEVAVVGDPTYPFDGVKGKVKSVKGGYADVEFPNGGVVPLHVNLLIPV